MNRTSIFSRRVKYLAAVFIILFSQLLPLYPQQAEAAADNWLNFKFDEFSQNTVDQFTLNGHATIPQGQNVIRLTQPTTLQSGAAFNNTALCPRDNYSFSTAFSFKMSNTSPSGASDGLTFTLQTGTTSQHRDGGGLGYYGISPSFAVKYDTFLNTVYNDPSANSVGLAVNGDVVNKPGWYTDLDSTSFKLSDGTQYYTWIDYNSSTQNVQVHLGTSPDRVNASKVLDVNGIDLGSIFNGQSIHAGFTGSTGSPNYETHDIHSWYFVNAYAPIDTLNPSNTYKVNEAPVVPGDSKVTAVNTPVSGQVIGTDPDGDPLTYVKGTTDPQNGTVTVNADGTWSYTPAQDFIGTDRFTVIANDGKCATAEATITVEVSDSVPPTTPPNACENPVALINGSFEQGPRDDRYIFPAGEVPGWKTTDPVMEIWDYEKGNPSPVLNFPPPPDGQRYAEVINLYQDVKTTPGQTLYWRLSHMGRVGVDTMEVRIGSATNAPLDAAVQEQIVTGNTAWKQYSGSYTVPLGQTNTRFVLQYVDTASGNAGSGNLVDDIFFGTEPCVVAEKSVSPAGQAFVGDELTYEVTIKNAGGDVAADTVFEDAIPEGTEYVPGSMRIVSGTNAGDLTDADDQDAGHFDGSKVIIRLGDVPNTTDLPDGITVQFKVRALSSHVGQTVTNQANIGYKNLLTDENETTKSNEVSAEIIEREVINACAKPVALINGSFEQPPARMPGDTGSPGSEHAWQYFLEHEVPGWKTTASDKFIQIMKNEFIYSGMEINPPHGNQYAELNAEQISALYQDVETTPGQTIYWRLAHRGLLGVDTMAVQIGSADIPIDQLPVIQQISTGNTGWKYYSGSYTVPAGQTTTRFAFDSVDAAGGNQRFGNLLDDIFLGTEACVTAEKSVSPAGEAFVGDELTYEVTIKNAGGDVAADTVFEDAIPEGTDYVPGSMKILNGPNVGDLTDTDDQDAGHFDGSKVIIRLGDVPNTNDLPDGITVQFKVKALSDRAGNSVANKATVGYKDLLTGKDETIPSNEVTTTVEYKEHNLESAKTAELFEKATGNTDAAHPEVGDTLLYTIQTRNTASDSRVTNLRITDEIPTGLEYVAGTLKVDDAAVTDAQDGDAGHFANGKVFAKFGDVTDTEAHKVTFQVKVLPGQAGKNIINIAAVEGDNVGTPDRPRNEVEVYPRNPQIETDKSVANTNVSKATYEVGDTITYTIRVRGVVNDTYLENLTITDSLPAGLEYVPGSLKVDGVTVTDPKDDDAGHSVTGDVYGSFGNIDDTNWHTLEFQAIILPGQGGLTIENTARVTGDNIDQPGEPTEKMVVEPEPPVEPPIEPPIEPPVEPPVNPPVDPDPPVNPPVNPDPPVNPPVNPDPPVTPPVTPPAPVMESRKTSRDLSGGTITVGDTLEYTISARNTVAGSYVSNLVIADILPEGLAYIAGSLKVDGVSVTDLADGDKGQYVNGKVSGNFGRITDTEWHTITFQATVKAGQAGQSIENIGEVTGDNVTTPEKPSNVIEVTDNENNGDNNTNPGGTDSDNDSNEDPNGNSNDDTDGDSNGTPNEDSNGGADGDSNTGAQTPDDQSDSALGESDAAPQNPAQSGDQATNEPNGNKLPNTATNMYSYLVGGAMMLLAGSLLLRRRKKA